jgi:hypothetical protein
MSILLFLNNLSYPIPVPEQVSALVSNLVAALREIRGLRRDAVLFTSVPLTDLELAPNYPFQRWAAEARNRDAFRFLRSLENRAPFRLAGSQDSDQMVEYVFDGDEAQGLGYAHALDGMAISFAICKDWDTSMVALTRRILVAENGDAELVESMVEARHVADPTHVRIHAQWLRTNDLINIRSGRQLWECRAESFPHLEFLPVVENNLIILDGHWLKPVRDRLIELERTMADWKSSQSMPVWQSKITPEAEHRKRFCQFVDLDGVSRSFDLHARFTPGPGRIHFRVDFGSRKLIIGYVGRKLGS